MALKTDDFTNLKALLLEIEIVFLKIQPKQLDTEVHICTMGLPSLLWHQKTINISTAQQYKINTEWHITSGQ